MSHTVTVTRTTTSTTTSAILLNIGYFKTLPGILKILHVVLGVVCVGIVGYHIKPVLTYDRGSVAGPLSQLFNPELFFLLIATTCLITSTLLLFSCLISIATATILPKTVFELVYHAVAFLLLLISSILYIIEIQASSLKQGPYVYNYVPGYKWRLAASEMMFLANHSILLFSASVHFFRMILDRNPAYYDTYNEPGYTEKIIAAVLGLVNSVLYGIAAFFSWRNFRIG